MEFDFNFDQSFVDKCMWYTRRILIQFEQLSYEGYNKKESRLMEVF